MKSQNFSDELIQIEDNDGEEEERSMMIGSSDEEDDEDGATDDRAVEINANSTSTSTSKRKNPKDKGEDMQLRYNGSSSSPSSPISDPDSNHPFQQYAPPLGSYQNSTYYPKLRMVHIWSPYVVSSFSNSSQKTMSDIQ